MQQEIIVAVVGTVVGGVALAILSRMYAQRAGVYRVMQPTVTWFNARPAATAGLISLLVALVTAAVITRSLEESLSVWNTEPPAFGQQIGGGDSYPDTVCPNGYYAAGVRSWGSPSTTKFCIGCLNGIQVICRKLNVK